MDHLREINLIREGSDRETTRVLLLISVAAMFLSAKYLEKTYPGFQQLVHITGLDYSYDSFISMETDILNELHWDVQYISVYDILTHFLCQGIFFISDELIDNSAKSN